MEECSALLNLLLRRNLSIMFAGDRRNFTALHLAIKHNSENWFRALVIYYPGRKCSNFKGIFKSRRHPCECNALHLAAAHGSVALCEELIGEMPSSLDLLSEQDLEGRTPSQVAEHMKHPECAKYLQSCCGPRRKRAAIGQAARCGSAKRTLGNSKSHSAVQPAPGLQWVASQPPFGGALGLVPNHMQLPMEYCMLPMSIQQPAIPGPPSAGQGQGVGNH